MLQRFAQISSQLESLGVDCRAPGFYDHPRFLAEESRDSTFLEQYAHFVAAVPTSAEYLRRVRIQVPIITSILHRELVADSRLGACVDIGMVLSRILEREGIWNVQIKGSLTIRFAEALNLPTQYFWSVDATNRPFAAAHSWLVVPPYSIVDIAVGQQPYRVGREHIPDVVVTEVRDSAATAIERIVGPEVLSHFRKSHGGQASTDTLARHLCPAWLRLRETFPSVVYRAESALLTYDAVAVGAPEVPFEQMDKWLLNGRRGIDVYNDVVVPALRASESQQSPP